MLSFLKPKKIVLDCFTYVSYAYDYAKIESAIKFIPKWWKDTPGINTEINKATIKHCQGLIELYKRGIVLPAWFSMNINILEAGNPDIFIWESSNSNVDINNCHPQGQFNGFAGADGINIKLSSPWALKTKEEIYFSWSEPTWSIRNLITNISVLPGVVNYKYQHATDINLFATLKDGTKQQVIIEPLTPLAILHPLTEKEIIIKNHLVSKDEWYRLHGANRLFFARNPQDSIKLYKSKKNLIDEIGCPFSKK